MKSYLPTLQGRNKWRTLQTNLVPGQLVLLGDAEDISGRGAYRLGRIHCLHPHIRQGKEVVLMCLVFKLILNIILLFLEFMKCVYCLGLDIYLSDLNFIEIEF